MIIRPRNIRHGEIAPWKFIHVKFFDEIYRGASGAKNANLLDKSSAIQESNNFICNLPGEFSEGKFS